MRALIEFVAVTISLIFIMAVQASSEQVPALFMKEHPTISGWQILNGWQDTPPSTPAAAYEWVPENAHWKGLDARIIGYEALSSDLKMSALQAAEAYGFNDARIAAFQEVEAVKLFVASDRAAGILVTGRLNGRSAKMIAWVWWHDFEPATSNGPVTGVHAFIASDEAFEQMGGYAPVAVIWLGASAPSDFSPLAAGSLSSQDQVDHISSLASAQFQNRSIAGSAETMLWLRGLGVANGVIQ